MATPKTNSNLSSAQSPERIAQNPNTCPHSIPMCPVCRATDELLRIVNAPKPQGLRRLIFSWYSCKV